MIVSERGQVMGAFPKENGSAGRVLKLSDVEGTEFPPTHSHCRGWTPGEGSVRGLRLRRTTPGGPSAVHRAF